MLVMAIFGAPVPLVLMGWYVVAAPRFVALFADFGAALLAVMASAGGAPVSADRPDLAERPVGPSPETQRVVLR